MISCNISSQHQSLKTQLKGLGGWRGEVEVNQHGDKRSHYLLAASTNVGFSESKESSSSTFLILNTQMRLMRMLYTEALTKCCLGHCLGQIHCHCMHL